jgi:hypothetical protein
MSDDPQDSPPVEKEYWHDRRREAARAAGALASSRSDGIRPTREDDSVSAATVVSHFRTSRALRHPIASFLVTVVAVIVLGVCLLAATGGGALGYPPVRLSDCAPANSALLGPRGAEFTAAFPAGRVYVEPAEVLDICGYVHPMKTATSQLFGGFVVTAVYGALSLHGDTYFGYRMTPSWVQPGDEVSISRRSASGIEAVRCDEARNWCQGWLRLSRGRARWVLSAGSDGRSLQTIELFLRSFQPAPTEVASSG